MRVKMWITPIAGALMVILVGAPVQAAAPFLLSGQIDSIDEGSVDAAGNSGRFVVKHRHIGGRLSGSIGTEFLTNVPFAFTFGTNVPLMTQSGNLHGVLDFGGYEARVAATTTLGLTPIPCQPGTPGCVPVSGGGFFPGLLISGTLTLNKGTTGHGTVEGFVVPLLDAQGHIVAAFGQVTLRSK